MCSILVLFMWLAVSVFVSGGVRGLRDSLGRFSFWTTAIQRSDQCMSRLRLGALASSSTYRSALAGAVRGRGRCCNEAAERASRAEQVRHTQQEWLSGAVERSQRGSKKSWDTISTSLLGLQPKRFAIGAWSVVHPPGLADLFSVPSQAGATGFRLDWTSYCQGTAEEHSTSFPIVPAGGSLRIFQGAFFSGEPHELYRQMARGLCVVLLQHPSTTLPSGQAEPAQAINFPHDPWWAPVDPWDTWAMTRAYWAQYLKAKALPRRQVLTETLTRRSHASIVVLRKAVLWPEGLTFSKTATLGGGGCREWTYFQKEGPGIVGLQPPEQAKPEGQPLTAEGLQREDLMHIHATVLHVNMLWHSNHYHFMSELLPRIWIVRTLLLRDPTIIITTGSSVSKSLKEAMELLGLPSSRLRVMNAPFTAEWALVPSGSGCTTSPPALRELATMGEFMLATAILQLVHGANMTSTAVLERFVKCMRQHRRAAAQPMSPEQGRRFLPPREAMPSVRLVSSIFPEDMIEYNRSYLRIPEQLRVMQPEDLLPAGWVQGRPVGADASRTEAVWDLDQVVESRSRPLVLVVHRDAKRLVQNEMEVVQWIYEVVPDAEVLLYGSMPLAQQAIVFRMAALIVAPHGAGLINVIFCKPDTPVVEVHTGKSAAEPNLSPWPPVYSQLTRGMGSAFFVLIVPGSNPIMRVSEGPLKRMVTRAWALSWWHKVRSAGGGA